MLSLILLLETIPKYVSIKNNSTDKKESTKCCQRGHKKIDKVGRGVYYVGIGYQTKKERRLKWTRKNRKSLF